MSVGFESLDSQFIPRDGQLNLALSRAFDLQNHARTSTGNIIHGDINEMLRRFIRVDRNLPKWYELENAGLAGWNTVICDTKAR